MWPEAVNFAVCPAILRNAHTDTCYKHLQVVWVAFYLSVYKSILGVTLKQLHRFLDTTWLYFLRHSLTLTPAFLLQMYTTGFPGALYEEKVKTEHLVKE